MVVTLIISLLFVLLAVALTVLAVKTSDKAKILKKQNDYRFYKKRASYLRTGALISFCFAVGSIGMLVWMMASRNNTI